MSHPAPADTRHEFSVLPGPKFRRARAGPGPARDRIVPGPGPDRMIRQTKTASFGLK